MFLEENTMGRHLLHKRETHFVLRVYVVDRHTHLGYILLLNFYFMDQVTCGRIILLTSYVFVL
jgi:hypothetical protein